MAGPDVERLRRRSDFLSAAKGRRVARSTLVVQMRPTGMSCARLGFTVSRKVGNAVERNRVKRRLREAVRQNVQACLRPGCDYVVIGRRQALTASPARLVDDLSSALARIHARREGSPPATRNPHG